MPSPRVRRAAQASASRMQSNEARLSKDLNKDDSPASSLRRDLSAEEASGVPAKNMRSVQKAPLEAGTSSTKPKKQYKKPTLADLQQQLDNVDSSFQFDASPVRDKARARTRRDVPSSPPSPSKFNGSLDPLGPLSKSDDRDLTGGRQRTSPRYPPPAQSHANPVHDRHGDSRTDYDNYAGESAYGDADNYGGSVQYGGHEPSGGYGGEEDPLGWSGEERVIPQLHPEIDPYVSVCARACMSCICRSPETQSALVCWRLLLSVAIRTRRVVFRGGKRSQIDTHLSCFTPEIYTVNTKLHNYRCLRQCDTCRNKSVGTRSRFGSKSAARPHSLGVMPTPTITKTITTPTATKTVTKPLNTNTQGTAANRPARSADRHCANSRRTKQDPANTAIARPATPALVISRKDRQPTQQPLAPRRRTSAR